jgi:hypothetical protein
VFGFNCTDDVCCRPSMFPFIHYMPQLSMLLSSHRILDTTLING